MSATDAKRLRILWLISKLDWQGGIGRIAAGATRALAERGHEVHVAGPAPRDPGPIPGVAVHCWSGSRRKPVRLAKLVALQRTLRANVIHLHSAHPHGEVVLGLRVLSRALGRPRVFLSPHSSYAYPKRRNRLGLLLAEHVVLSSHWSAEQAIRAGLPAERADVVPPGIDVPHASGDGPRDKVVLSLGRLVAPKAVHLTIDAFDLAARERPEWRLHIVGSGPERDALRAHAAAKACRERIVFLGYVPEADKLRELAHAEIGLLPSVRENSPGALLEFQAHGLAVVASDVGGVPELARDPAQADAETAVLVEPGNPAAVAGALGRLMDDPQRRRAIGAAARAFAVRHSWPAIAEQYERLYLRELSRERAAS